MLKTIFLRYGRARPVAQWVECLNSAGVPGRVGEPRFETLQRSVYETPDGNGRWLVGAAGASAVECS